MSGAAAVIVIVVIVLVAALLGAIAVSVRRRRLQSRFGPEYDRAVNEQSSTFRAEAELAGRERRVRKLDIRLLSDEARRRYRTEAMNIQEEFVDSPETSVAAAHALVTHVMQERGYPAEDDEQAMSDLSVEHAQTVGNFRAAQQISASAAAGQASTEDLRQALIHYRALFADLLGEQQLAEHADAPRSDGQSSAPAPEVTAEANPDGLVVTPGNDYRRNGSSDDVR